MIAMEYFVPQYVILGVGVATALIAVFTITANGMLLFVIYKDPFKCLRKPSTGLIAALCATNLLKGLVTDTLYAQRVLEGFADSSVHLKLGKPYMVSGFITYTSEILLIVALTLERVLANGFIAFHRNHLRFKTAVIASCFIWLYSLCFALLQVLKINETLYNLVDVYLHHAAPIIAITLLNGTLCFLIRRHHRAIIPAQLLNAPYVQQMTANGIPTQQDLQVRRERQLAIVVLIIGLLLFLFLMPYFVVMVLNTYCSSCDRNKLHAALVLCIPVLYLKSVINPYLYAWRLPQYKRSFRAVVVLPTCK